MLVEIHMLQNHSPSNVNRDDLGAPKTCFFGGSLRARISSQCIKRSIRWSPAFRKHLRGCLGTRTKYFPDVVRHLLPTNADIPQDEHDAIVQAACNIAKAEDSKAAQEEGAPDDRPRTAQLIFLGPGEAEAFVARLAELRQSHPKEYKVFLHASGPEEEGEAKGKKKGKGSSKALAVIHAELRKAYSTRSVDVALFGRMTTSDAFEDVEAAMEVAHALSTHEVSNEIDYFTAVDDLGEGPGAGHVAENQFNSACYYKYFSLDWEMLRSHLAGGEAPGDLPESLAARALGAFLLAVATAVPSGKKKGHANNNPPDGILVEVKNDHVPTSYANAFVGPVRATPERDLVAESIAHLGHYAGPVVKGFDLGAKRFWFCPRGLALGQDVPDLETAETLDALIVKTLKCLGHDWAALKSTAAKEGEA